MTVRICNSMNQFQTLKIHGKDSDRYESTHRLILDQLPWSKEWLPWWPGQTWNKTLPVVRRRTSVNGSVIKIAWFKWRRSSSSKKCVHKLGWEDWGGLQEKQPRCRVNRRQQLQSTNWHAKPFVIFFVGGRNLTHYNLVLHHSILSILC